MNQDFALRAYRFRLPPFLVRMIVWRIKRHREYRKFRAKRHLRLKPRYGRWLGHREASLRKTDLRRCP